MFSKRCFWSTNRTNWDLHTRKRCKDIWVGRLQRNGVKQLYLVILIRKWEVLLEYSMSVIVSERSRCAWRIKTRSPPYYLYPWTRQGNTSDHARKCAYTVDEMLGKYPHGDSSFMMRWYVPRIFPPLSLGRRTRKLRFGGRRPPTAYRYTGPYVKIANEMMQDIAKHRSFQE